ncbi:MAG: peptidylprolyl isomerase [Victivallales bacterium]
MKKQLCLASVILIFGASCTWFSAEKKPEAALKEVRNAESAPAKEVKTAASAPAAADTKAVKPAPEKPADANADPLAFLPDIVAGIGDEKISRENIREEFKPILAMMKENGQLAGITQDVWKAEVKERLNDIIASKLLMKLATADGYKPDPAKAEEEFKNVTAQIPADQLDDTLSKQGMTPAMIKDKIGIGLAIQKWIDDKIAVDIKVSDDEAEKYYRENQERFKKPEGVHAFHILFKPEEIAPEAAAKMSPEEKTKAEADANAVARKKAEDILAKLKQGGDFAKLAAENSACPSKEKGGDLGTFEKGKMSEEFEKAAFALKPGELSGIVETEYGFHIIKVTEKIQPDYIPFTEVKGFLLEGMKNQKTSEIIQGRIEEEKKKQKVEIFIN